MNGYENFLYKSIVNLKFQKNVFEYISNEIQVAFRRLDAYNIDKKLFEEEAIVTKAEENSVVDVTEVDDLIAKAQLLLKGDSNGQRKIKNNKTKQLKKIDDKPKNKNLLKQPAIPSSKVTVALSKQKQKHTTDRSKQTSAKTSTKKESVHFVAKEAVSKNLVKSAPVVPFSEDFLTVYKESLRLGQSLHTSHKRNKQDTEQSQKQFLDVLGDVDVDEKPCFIEKTDCTEQLLARHNSSRGANCELYFSNLKEWLLLHIEMEIENQRLEFLTLYSEMLRDCLMSNDPTVGTYRLVHWQLTRTLPVLVSNDI